MYMYIYIYIYWNWMVAILHLAEGLLHPAKASIDAIRWPSFQSRNPGAHRDISGCPPDLAVEHAQGQGRLGRVRQ